MAALEDKQKDQLRDLFKTLDKEVKIIFFTQEFECQYCKLTHELLEEVASLSDKITLLIRELVKDGEEAKKFGVDKIPAVVIMGETDYGIRFFGVPAGYEFTPLIEDIIHVSRGNPGLPEDVLAELRKVDQPVHLQVFTSPTCPYCPMAVRAAHKLAMASDNIRADMVETAEFPFLVSKFEVQGVPHTVINDFYSFVGPLPELETVYEILRAIGKEAPPVHVHEHEREAMLKEAHDHEHHHEHEHEREQGRGGKKAASPQKAKAEKPTEKSKKKK